MKRSVLILSTFFLVLLTPIKSDDPHGDSMICREDEPRGHHLYSDDLLWRNDPDSVQFMRKMRDMAGTGGSRSRGQVQGSTGLTCKVCLVLAEFVSDLLKKSFSHKVIASATLHGCVIGKLYPPEVCKLAIEEWQDTFFWIADHTAFQPKDLCGFIFYPHCGSKVFPPAQPWNVTFPNVTRPPYTPLRSPPKDSPTLKVLFLTDFHVDPYYVTGTAVDCAYPLCCRDLGLNTPFTLGQSASPWGSIGKCDVPPRTLEDMLKHATSGEEKFDLVFFTGDIPPHDVYNQTIASQLEVFNLTHSLLAKKERRYFPHTPVLAALGNHESNPVDQFAPPFTGPGESAHPMHWLYSAMAQHWGHWLPNSTLHTIKKGGFWSWDLYPGRLRVISVNSNFGSESDWYMWFFGSDVNGQMQWLVDQLQDAEDHKMRVWILCHHPDPRVAQFKSWMNKIIQRYSGSISGLFYGHSHLDEFRVYYDTQMGDMPVVVGRVGPGLTGYHGDGGMNFGYQVLTLDGDRKDSTFAVLDIESRILNLTETMQTGVPVWRKEYSMREAFNMTSLFAADYDALIGRMKSDNQSASLYAYYKYKSSREKAPCTGQCLKDLISMVVRKL